MNYSRPTHLFLYDKLQHGPLYAAILGVAEQAGKPAELPGFEPVGSDMSFPVHFVENENGITHGILVQNLDLAAIERLGFFLCHCTVAFEPRHIFVSLDGVPVEATIYVPTDNAPKHEPFNFADWQSQFGEIETIAAREALTLFEREGPYDIAGKYAQMRFRAASTVRAAKSCTPTALRHDGNAKDVAVKADRRPYTNFFSVDERDFRFPLFNGDLSDEVERACFIGGDAVTVLPYDPKRDNLLLIEQFRFGPFSRGDQRPWVLEPPAGRIDVGEAPEQAAIRELAEEANLTTEKLHQISSYYPTPGVCTEYLFSFVAICDLPPDVAGIGGLESEDEDIRSHVISFDQAMKLTQSGEADTAPLLLSLYWLENRRFSLADGG